MKTTFSKWRLPSQYEDQRLKMKTKVFNMKTKFGGNDTRPLQLTYGGMARPILSEDAAQRALSVGEEFKHRQHS